MGHPDGVDSVDDSETGDSETGDSETGDSEWPEVPVLELSLSQVKQFDFDWMPALGAEYYQLLESVDVGEPYVQVGEDVLGLATSLTVPLHFRLNASYVLRACNVDSCTDSEPVVVAGPLVEAIGYFKASNTDEGDHFGISVALSGDGNTLAVGADHEDSSATGVAGDQADNSAETAGAVYVFVRDDQDAWSQQAYVKASYTDPQDWFGKSVALSDDGNTLAVGAYRESGGAMGINGDQADNSADEAGAVYVFVRDDQNAWLQQAYVKASHPDPGDWFGLHIALADDGNTLAVGATGDDSSATGIDGDQTDNTSDGTGAVYVFMRDGQSTWSQQAYIKASSSTENEYFGFAVVLSGDGNTLAVGTEQAVYMFVRDGQATWSQQAFIEGPTTDDDDFGTTVALSDDGKTLAVGAPWEGSSATGINGDQTDNSAPSSGAAYVFVRDGQNAWSQQAYVKASNCAMSDYFGTRVALSADGDALVVSADWERSAAPGVGSNQADNSVSAAGAAYVFTRDDQDAWAQQAYVKASNARESQQFGISVALSGDANTLVVGAFGDDSSATGIGGNQDSESLPSAGAVYLY